MMKRLYFSPFRAFIVAAIVINGMLALTLYSTLRTSKAEATPNCVNAYCIHWYHSKYVPVSVHFRDYSGSIWPIHEAVNRWDSGTPNLIVVWHPGSYNCGSSCVNVGEYNVDDGKVGHTDYSWDGNAHFIPGREAVWLNDRYAMTPGQRLEDACHETGHALGLGHNTPQGDGSCMVATVDGSGEWPLQEDYDTLTYMYGHTH